MIDRLLFRIKKFFSWLGFIDDPVDSQTTFDFDKVDMEKTRKQMYGEE